MIEAGRVPVLVKHPGLLLHASSKVGEVVLPCRTNFTDQVANEAHGELGACDCFSLHR